MTNIERHQERIGDPPPSFPTDAEIEIADQLRHQLEERYFGSSSPNVPLQIRGWTKANTSFG